MSHAPNPATILIAEDNEADRRLLKRAFRKTALKTTLVSTTDGKEALAFLRNSSKPLPSLILLDIHMPRLDGYRFLEIRRTSREPFSIIPVIMLTTSNNKDDVEKCYTLGANAYIKKTANTDEMIYIVQKFIEFWLNVAIIPKHATSADLEEDA